MKNVYMYMLLSMLCTIKSFGQGSDVIFLIDNSGSILSGSPVVGTTGQPGSEYYAIYNTVQSIMYEVLTCNSNNRVAVVQYGDTSNTHGVYIESDFTNSAITFVRRYANGGGVARAVDIMSDAISGLPNTGIDPAGSSTLSYNTNNSLIVFIFSDAYRNQDLLSNGDPVFNNNPGFSPYTYLKETFGAKFVVHLVQDDVVARAAAAGIASAGGTYSGAVEQYSNDPDDGVSGRWLIAKTAVNGVSTGFELTPEELQTVADFICPEEEIPCQSLTLNSEPNTVYTYFDKSDITTVSAGSSSYVINSGIDITMHAQDFIVLKPDTHIKSGALYLAEIQPCETNGGTSPRMAAPKEPEQKAETLLAGKTFALMPNPATTQVTISASVGLQSVLVTSLDGKVMYTHTYRDTPEKADIDITSYAQGYYTVTVTTTDGQVQTQKLIKN